MTQTVSDQPKTEIDHSNMSLPSIKNAVIPEKKSEEKSPPTPEPTAEHNFENEFSDSEDEPVATAKPEDSDSDI